MLHQPFDGYRPLLPKPLEQAWVDEVNALQLAEPFASPLALKKQAYQKALCDRQPQAMHEALYRAVDSLMSRCSSGSAAAAVKNQADRRGAAAPDLGTAAASGDELWDADAYL